MSPTIPPAASTVYKKKSPNSKVTLYLDKRIYVDHLTHTDSIDGVVVVNSDYLNGRKVYGELITKYIYGREEDEVMGLQFSKEFILINEQVVPSLISNTQLTVVQKRLLKKYGGSAYTFTFQFPEESPCSVVIQSLVDAKSRPLGVEYYVRMYVAQCAEEVKHRRSTAALAIKKIQYAPLSRKLTIPNALVTKEFTFSPGKISLEVVLDNDIYYHGESISVNILIINHSRKSVRNVKAYVIQHCDVTMVNAEFSRYVARSKSREGCPVIPGESLNKIIPLTPHAKNNKDLNGVALDDYLKNNGVNLASSTLFAKGKSASEALGIVVSYYVKVKLDCGHLAGKIVAEVPFKLLKPAPCSSMRQGKKKVEAREHAKCNYNAKVKLQPPNAVLSDEEVLHAKMKMNAVVTHDNLIYDSEDLINNIVFEDFSNNHQLVNF